MKIALVGYGGMGHAVGRIASERGHEVVVVDPHAEEAVCASLAEADLDEVDVVVDFSLGEFALDHLELCAERGVNLVIGSTGWYDSLPEVREKVESRDIGMMWSSNFSIGVNLYFKMVEAAAKMIDKFDEYDVWGHEIHHFNKADSPSGTAKSLEQILLENISRKDSVVEEKLYRRREFL
jgi:4-hydroxy-tetrahydrodipicolinate reductase